MDLFRAGWRRGLPVEGRVHDLPHLFEPPLRAVQPLVTLRRPAADRLFETDFHLFALHSLPFVFPAEYATGSDKDCPTQEIGKTIFARSV